MKPQLLAMPPGYNLTDNVFRVAAFQLFHLSISSLNLLGFAYIVLYSFFNTNHFLYQSCEICYYKNRSSMGLPWSI
jgi:hypothetical protein